ncbi:2-oxoacid:acceptor oxidoreductase family protein [Clostridium bornimense]|uniref:2-oxoacid:acceptor oxidoreductase family protein n=1 Tax=Clostridium bornimense TaxID=1216932 RepID=UPI001C10CE28|nr:2-oxoacid:acceptor oxidoreductase family protein [Clostridium bornimense]MBU5316862.1 2-oxoacid:acceptor oxidoreductase family protein [Clostridium bornimense]
MIEITFLGRGGQGAFTSSRILAIAASLYGDKYALSFPSFGPERRGAPVFAYTKIDDKPIRDRSQCPKSDYIVILDESLYTENLKLKLKDGGKIILNTSNNHDDKDIETFDGIPIATKFLGVPITNTAMLSALVLITGIVTKDQLINAIEYDLKPAIAGKNKKLIEHVSILLGSDKNE